jgi:hypothetical protein
MTSTPKPPPTNRKRKALNDDRLDNAFEILQASSNALNDESQSFGNFVAMKLRTFDEDVGTQLQADIMGLFYSQPAMSSYPSNVQSLSHNASENVLFTSHLQPLHPVHYPNIPSTSTTASDSLSLCFRGQAECNRSVINTFFKIGFYSFHTYFLYYNIENKVRIKT